MTARLRPSVMQQTLADGRRARDTLRQVAEVAREQAKLRCCCAVYARLSPKDPEYQATCAPCLALRELGKVPVGR